jgi:asparagine synthase (glutamine-hydrolysing)
MCGICGKVSLNGAVSENLIRKMCEVLTHRGPDSEGICINPSPQPSPLKGRGGAVVGLGHRRLAIIDLSPAGHQPMSNEDGSIWIVFNGEIYNFPELREALEKKGHRFKSHSDTEVVLHLYEDKGVDCLKDLRGPFAFAIWDSRGERLFIAKDRIGKKPLYYTYKNQTLTFASEIKAILQDPEVSAEVNRPAITDYLSYGYTPTPETMFKGIMKLPPAHFITYEKGNIKIEKYWELNFSKKLKLSEREYCDKTMDMLEECTKIRLISDVPLGAFLSGGIDSSAVVYMMSKLSSKPVKTFSIGFEEESHSELKYAAIIAKRFNTEHHEYIVKPDAIELLPKLVWHYNEPYADSSALPSYYVAQITRQEVTVALNGDGGDECFGGYERFMASKYAEILSKIPYFLRNGILANLVKILPESIEPGNFSRKLKRFIAMAEEPCRVKHYNWVSIFRDFEKDSLFSDSFKKEYASRRSLYHLDKVFNECGSKDILDQVMFADIKTNLLDDLIVKMDIATMANSLEGRSPFLDHKMMEFCARLPSDMKIKGMKLKYILKKALSDSGALPEEILKRKKMGFGIPVDKWFRVDLKDYVYEILMSDKCLNRGYFKRDSVKKLLDEHVSAKANNGARIWSLLFLELWHREFIDKGQGA